MKKKRSKYGVDLTDKGKKERTYQDILYDSKTEMLFYKEYLEPRISTGEIIDVKRQVPYTLQESFTRLNGDKILPIKYISDFDVTYADGRFVVYDVKGNPDNLSKQKRKIFWRRYPKIELIFICRNIKYGGWIPYDELEKKRKQDKKDKKNNFKGIE